MADAEDVGKVPRRRIDIVILSLYLSSTAPPLCPANISSGSESRLNSANRDEPRAKQIECRTLAAQLDCSVQQIVQ